MRQPVLVAALPLMLVAAPTVSAQDAPPTGTDTAYVAGEFRVFTGAGIAAAIEDIVAAMGRHQVVFVGETHDDPTGHMLELALLRRAAEVYGAGDAPRPVVLSLEFFERDIQLVLDEYLDDVITEPSFRAASRPWPRYQTDYRPMVEFAKERGLAVIAANAPRRYVTRVGQLGRESLHDLSADARRTLAPLPYGQPSDAYRRQWIQTIMKVQEEEGMKCGLPVPAPADGEAAAQARAPVGTHTGMGNQMHSQVLWDATMAHAVALALAEQPDALVLHMVGGFHVERGTGIPEHLEAYRPGTTRMIVAVRPVENVEVFEPAPEGLWGDFVIQTDEARTLEAIECREYLAGQPQ